MIFNIKKGATLPELQLQLIENGYVNKNKFVKNIQNAIVRFSMYNAECGKKVVICREMEVREDCNTCLDCPKEYILVYKFRPRDTKKSGIFTGEVEIDFLDGCGKLKLPIGQELIINVI